MALLFIDSFDHYDTASILDKWTANFTACKIEIGKGRCGTNCLGLSTFNQINKGIPFAGASGTVGFAAWMASALTLSTAEINICEFNGVTSTPHFTIWWHATDGSLSVEVNSSPSVEIGRTPPDVVREDTWYFIEVQATIAASGSVIVRVNNIELLNLSGVNTIGGGAGGTGVTALRGVGFNCGSNETWMLDDVYVLDDTGPAPWNTFLGDCRVEYLRPRAAGGSQTFPVVVGSSGSHWRAVDDNAVPDEDVSYVEADAPGQTDTNLYQPTGLPAGQPIFGAQLSLHARKSEIGPRVISPVVNGVAGPAQYSPSMTTYSYHHTMYPVNPATGNPWTVAEINAIDAGATVVV